jgi:hypothetical protein
VHCGILAAKIRYRSGCDPCRLGLPLVSGKPTEAHDPALVTQARQFDLFHVFAPDAGVRSSLRPREPMQRVAALEKVRRGKVRQVGHAGCRTHPLTGVWGAARHREIIKSRCGKISHRLGFRLQ